MGKHALITSKQFNVQLTWSYTNNVYVMKDSSDGGGETSPTLDKLDVYGDGPWTFPT